MAFSARSSRDFSATSRDLACKVLAVNPDVSTLWNYVRESLLADFPVDAGCEDTSALRAAIAGQLAASAAGIARNPKSYPAWAHRVWIVGTFAAARDSGAVDLLSEISLCAKLLAADERNFHCWQYRRWVSDRHARLGGDAGEASASAEIVFTRELITKNFSNYSAWHARASLFERAPVSAESLAAELDLVRRAVFTEPDDQSPWFYRRWVISKLMENVKLGGRSTLASGNDLGAGAADSLPTQGAPDAGESAAVAVFDDVAALAELEAAEPLCKWPAEARAHALAALATCNAIRALADAGRLPSRCLSVLGLAREEARAAYVRLAKLDARHEQYFLHQAAILVQ
jgi:geranylgeranyl transferase type-2 subunit alpha